MIRAQIAVPENPDYPVVLLEFTAYRLVQAHHKLLDKTRGFTLRLAAYQPFFRVFTLVYRLVTVAVLVVTVVAVEGNEVNVHHRQARHHEASQSAYVSRRVD